MSSGKKCHKERIIFIGCFRTRKNVNFIRDIWSLTGRLLKKCSLAVILNEVKELVSDDKEILCLWLRMISKRGLSAISKGGSMGLRVEVKVKEFGKRFLGLTLCFLLFVCLPVLKAEELMLQQYITGLKDKKDAVRISSAKSLGEIGKPEVVEALRDALSDKSKSVRLEVINALSKIHNDASVSALGVAIRDKDTKVRLAAIDALANINSKSAIGPLIDATKDKDNKVKISAINLLGSLGDESVIPTLSPLVADKNIKIRLVTIYAVGSIGGVEAIRALSTAVNDKKDEISVVAINVLGALGDKDATPLLTAVLRQRRDITVYDAVADALVSLGSKSAIPSLVEFLDKIDEEQKGKFQEAIVKIIEKNRIVSVKKEIEKPKSVETVQPAAAVSPAAPVPAAVPEKPAPVPAPQVQPENSQQEKLKLMGEHYTAGVNFYQKREYEKAAAELEEALKIDPNNKQSKEMLEKIKKQIKK